MNVGHPIISFDVANHHREEMLRSAAERRLIVEAHGARSVEVGALRRHAGNLLVRFGEHLQGARRLRIAEELESAPGALRLAR